MKQFALVWVMTRGGPMWGRRPCDVRGQAGLRVEDARPRLPVRHRRHLFVIIFGLSLLLTRVLAAAEALEF